MQVVEHGRRQARRLIVAMAAITLLDEAAAAADNAPNKDAAPTPTAQSVPDALRQLTDPGGWRSRLEQAGLQFTFTYYGDGFGNPRGGVTQGSGYDGRFGIIADADMEKLAGWSGASLHASIQPVQRNSFAELCARQRHRGPAVHAPVQSLDRAEDRRQCESASRPILRGTGVPG
jgi:carbohydrate-selective porin OprB